MVVRSPFVSIVGLLVVGSAAPHVGALNPTGTDDVPLIPRSALFGNPERAGVQISPDGQWIGYLAPIDGVLNVWIEPAAGGEAQPVTNSTDRPVGSYTWAWNNAQILYTQDENGDENAHVYAVDVESRNRIDLTPHDDTAASILSTHRDHPDEILVMMNARDKQMMDVHRVNTRTGESSVLFENDGGYVGMIPDDSWTIRVRAKMTPAGGNLIERRENAESAWNEYMSIPMEDAMTTAPMGFSKSGATFYLLDSTGRDTGALVAETVGDDGEPVRKTLHADDHTDISDIMANPITGEPEAAATTYLRKEWTILDPAIAADMKALRGLDDGDVEVISRSGDDRVWIAAYLDDDGPVKYWMWNRDTEEGRYLFTNRPDLEGYPLVDMETVEVEARDGLVLPCYLSLPADRKDDEAVPMVLFVHGGPWARDGWGYNPYHQWLANRGYAVLSVNFRGSTGFGKDFVNAGNREWAGAMQNDLSDAVQWAIDQGVADPDRVAIMGGSYGGYATLVGMTDTPELYACGVDIVGPSHVRTLLETIPPYWQPIVDMFETRVGGLDEPEWLDKISPLTRVDQIQDPLLIGQGANDPRVKISESDQIVAAMDSNELPVTYVVFPDEGHGFRKPENSQAFNAVTEIFLAKHLGGRAEPLADAVADSTAQVRSFGDLDLPGVELYVPPEDESTSKPVETIAFEDLTAEQQAMATQMLEQIEQQVTEEMLPMVKQQLESQIGMAPEEAHPAINYVIQELDRRIDG